MSWFTADAYYLQIINPEPEDLVVTKKIENSTEPKLILLINNTVKSVDNTTATQTFYAKDDYIADIKHKYAVGSLKLWYSDDDFSDGSSLQLDVFLTSVSTKSVNELEKPCFTMKIPQPQRQSDFEYIYFGEAHDSDSLVLIIKFQISQKITKPKSLALRDLTLHLTNELQNITYSQAKCPFGQSPDENGICQDCAANCEACFGTKPSQCLSCSRGSHWWNAECLNCHDNCGDCTGPTQHECLGCNFGFYDYGNSTCLDTCDFPFHSVGTKCGKVCKSDQYAFRFYSICLPDCPTPFIRLVDNNGILSCESPCSNYRDFLYTNGSCLSVCQAPLVAEFGDFLLKLCKNPCESILEYLYANGKCDQECKAPLQMRSDSMANYCVNPCESKKLYLYSNGSCLPNCPGPLVTENKHGVKFCKSPCKSASDYLFVNGSCFKECPAPLQIKIDFMENYCVNPCESEKLYLYSNRSCLPVCPKPLVAVSEGGVRYCRNPCKSASEYLYANQSCLEKCPAPWQVRSEPGVKYCRNPCPLGSLYFYGNGSCLSTCPTPLVATFEGPARFCSNPCSSKSDYLYANRSCLKTCLLPFQIKSDSTANYCVNPCAKSNLYLYSNGSCLSTCLFPGKIKEEFGVKNCLPPCRMTEEYILNDGSCSIQCPAPLMQKTVVSVGTFCLNPCESDYHFIVRNESCSLNCPAYFETRVEYGVKYCNPPCYGNQYYFIQNKSCLDTCANPLKVISEEGINICKSPCLEPSSFLYDDQSCHQSCPGPLIIEEKYSCKSPCPKGYANADGSCQESCEYPYTAIKKGPYKICRIDLGFTESAQVRKMGEAIKMSNTVVEIGGMLSCLISCGDPISIFMMPLLSMFQKVIYIDVVLPGNTELILEHLGGANEAEGKLPSKSTLLIVKIISLIALLIAGLLKVTASSNGSKFYQLLVKCDFSLRWNILIPIFISMSGDLLLSSLIDLTKFHSNSLRGTFGLLITSFTLFKISTMSRRRERDLPRWRFLFEIFSENQRFFILIYFVRMIVYHLIIGLFSHHPRFQAFLMVSMSFGMCFYLIWMAPIEKRISKVQYLIVEFALLLYNFIFGILAVFDFTTSSMADILGQLMNVVYFITSAITATIIILKILQTGYSHYKACSSSETSQSNQIQLSEMNQESDLDSPPASVRFEPLNQEEEEGGGGVNYEDPNNFDSEEDSIEPSIAIE